MTILVLVVMLSLLIQFQCSLFEATLYTTRLGSLEAARSAGRKVALASQMIELKKNIAQPLASLVILGTIANTAGAALAGFYASEALGAGMVPLFSAIFTALVLFVGEIMPKTLGALHWRRIWPFIVFPLTVMKYALYPAVALTQKFANLLAFGHKAPSVTEAEILAVVRMGATEGQITHGESLLVHNIINLENKPIKEIMTPRTVVFSLDADMTVQEAIIAIDQKGFTRIPVYEGDRENIVGYIIIHDLFCTKALAAPDMPLKALAKQISFVPATRDSLALLTSFLKQRKHIAVVVDEYGGVAGLVTLEDLIETLLGNEIVDETDVVVDLQEKARQLNRQRVSS